MQHWCNIASSCLISIEGCSWEIEIVCKACSALLSHTVSPSVRSDKHWTVITPICGCIAQHNPAQFSHAHKAAHRAHFDRKIDSNYEKRKKKKKGGKKEKSLAWLQPYINLNSSTGTSASIYGFKTHTYTLKMHYALLRESSEAGKTFPIIVGRSETYFRQRIGWDAASCRTKPQATCTQELYARGTFLWVV